jgi:hypothetical protein
MDALLARVPDHPQWLRDKAQFEEQIAGLEGKDGGEGSGPP